MVDPISILNGSDSCAILFAVENVFNTSALSGLQGGEV
jgi:hypothetical protein